MQNKCNDVIAMIFPRVSYWMSTLKCTFFWYKKYFDVEKSLRWLTLYNTDIQTIIACIFAFAFCQTALPKSLNGKIEGKAASNKNVYVWNWKHLSTFAKGYRVFHLLFTYFKWLYLWNLSDFDLCCKDQNWFEEWQFFMVDFQFSKKEEKS